MRPAAEDISVQGKWGSVVRLVRLPNLLIVLLTQTLLHRGLIRVFLEAEGIPLALDALHFGMLGLATVLAAAIGYVVNDLLDVEIDLRNRPARVVIGRGVSVREALALMRALFFGGVLLSIYLALYVERLPLAALFPLAVALLWVYARWLKRMPFWGNLLVSLFCAGVVALLWLAETEGIARLRALAPERAALLQVVFWAFAALAFLANLFREIVKDLEDLEGDAAAGARTLPVVWGPEGSRRWAFLPGVLLILLMVWGGLWLYGRGLVWSGLWAGLGVVGLQAGALLHLGKAKSSADYGAVSRQAKLVMGGGLLLLGIILLEL